MEAQRLLEAVRKLEAFQRESMEKLSEAEESLPVLLSKWALGEVGEKALNDHMAEIARLKQTVSSPWQEAKKPILAKLNALNEEKARKRRTAEIIEKEQAFRIRFNDLQEKPENHALWEQVKTEAQSHHRKEVETLSRLWSYYKRDRLDVTPGSQSFADYCVNNGCGPLSTIITEKTICTLR